MAQNKNDYSEAVKIAEKSVKNISDPKLKLIAFETILKDILSNKSEIIDKSEIQDNDLRPKEIVTPKGKERSPLIAKFSTKLNIDSSDVEYIYNINEEKKSYVIVCDFQHNIGKWSQINFVLLTLFANYVIYGQRASLSLPIIRGMKDYGFGDLPNINAFMRSISPQFAHVMTKKKKSENTFELTENGIKAVKTLCQEIVKRKGIVPLHPLHLPQKSIRSKSSPLAINILNQITEGFFDKPRTIQELKLKLEEKGSFYDRNIVDEKIRRRFLGRELKRLKIDKTWHYVIK